MVERLSEKEFRDKLRKVKGYESYKVLAVRLRTGGKTPNEANLCRMMSGARPITKNVAKALGYVRTFTRHPKEYFYEQK